MKKWEVAKRHDIIFQDAYQAYIDSLEWGSEEPTTRDEWEKIIKSEAEDYNEEVTQEIIDGLIDWLDEDGFVK